MLRFLIKTKWIFKKKRLNQNIKKQIKKIISSIKKLSFICQFKIKYSIGRIKELIKLIYLIYLHEP